MKEIYIVTVDDKVGARYKIIRNIQLSKIKNLVKIIEFANINEYLSWLDDNADYVCGVFLDINFNTDDKSNHDGIKALKITREKYKNLPVSIITATDSFEGDAIEEIAHDLGITAYLKKGELINDQIRKIAFQYYNNYISRT